MSILSVQQFPRFKKVGLLFEGGTLFEGGSLFKVGHYFFKNFKSGTLFRVGHYSRLGHYSNNYGIHIIVILRLRLKASRS